MGNRPDRRFCVALSMGGVSLLERASRHRSETEKQGSRPCDGKRATKENSRDVVAQKVQDQKAEW